MDETFYHGAKLVKFGRCMKIRGEDVFLSTDEKEIEMVEAFFAQNDLRVFRGEHSLGFGLSVG